MEGTNRGAATGLTAAPWFPVRENKRGRMTREEEHDEERKEKVERDGAVTWASRRLGMIGKLETRWSGSGLRQGRSKAEGGMDADQQLLVSKKQGDGHGGWIGRRVWLAACGWNLGDDEWLVRLEI